jgi:hypothetical protein
MYYRVFVILSIKLLKLEKKVFEGKKIDVKPGFDVPVQLMSGFMKNKSFFLCNQTHDCNEAFDEVNYENVKSSSVNFFFV